MKAKQFFMKFASWHLWLNLLGMLLLIVLLLFGLKWWLGYYTHHGEQIEVPDLYGKDYREATRMVEELGLRIEVNDSTYINPREMPAGCVVVQSPVKGMNVKEGRTIYVTINSLTIPRVKIPDIIDNCGYREAQARLQALEFRVMPPKLIDGEKDWVYGIQLDGRNVRAGDMVARESQLTLVIGNGAYGDEYSFGDDDDEFFGYTDDAAGNNSADEPVGDDDVDDFLPVGDEEWTNE